MSKIVIYQPDDIKPMQEACFLAKSVLDYISPFVTEGISTEELDKLCYDFIIKNGATPAPLNYHGFPKSICTSVNDIVCHGIPSKYKLLNGDIINIDITVNLNGWFGDTSRMYKIGECSKLADRLIAITEQALDIGIKAVKIGGTFGDIGYSIQRFVESNGFSVVRDYCGHGIGRHFHEDPMVLHYGIKDTGEKIKPGMFFTIEPMVNAGSHKTKVLKDKWTAVTVDKSLSAQFEHTIAVTDNGVLVLTR